MHFDALTLAAVADELRETVASGRVQQIVLPDSRSVALEIYAHRERRHLLLSAHPQASRVHLLEHKPRRGVPKETPLLLLLRKYVRSARLASVELPAPFERVLFLRFHHPQHGATTLAVEPIGQLGNVILLNAEGRILDALVRVPAGENAQRVLLPRREYQLPPPQDRLPPLGESDDPHGEAGRSPADGDGAGEAQAQLLWRSLLNRFAGVSPTLAREAAWRASGDAGAPVDNTGVCGGAQGTGRPVVGRGYGRLDARHRRGRGGGRGRVCGVRAPLLRRVRADGIDERGGCRVSTPRRSGTFPLRGTSMQACGEAWPRWCGRRRRVCRVNCAR